MRGAAPRKGRRRDQQQQDAERTHAPEHRRYYTYLDNVTHSLFALTLARTRLGRARGATAALLIASNAPDVDIVTAYRSAANYVKWHRGPTHGPLGVVGLGLVTAAIVWSVDRWKPPRRSSTKDTASPLASFATLAGIAMLGVLCHVLMDFPTPYGTRLFSPFDWHWYSVDWMPIVDVYLLIVLAAGLVFGQMTPEIRRHNVAIALTLMAGNYILRGTAHSRAVALAPRLFGPTLPQPCSEAPISAALIQRWPGEPLTVPGGGRRCVVEVAATPTMLSPFRWRVIARLSNAYEMQDIDVLDRRFLLAEAAPQAPWRTMVRVSNQWTPAVAEAATAPTASIFLGFSRFPAARSAVNADGVTTVRWTDMRFGGNLLTLNRQAPAPGPFAVVVQVGAGNQVLDDRLER